MNSWNGIGRLVSDPEVKYTNGGTTIGRFRLAVDRRIKKEDQPTADFIPCLAFGKTAEFLEKYFHKGMKAAVTGSIQTGSYKNKDGQTVYTTDILVDNIEFVESKQQEQHKPEQTTKQQEDFMQVPDTLEEQLPFS
jgi:single-strand DNA-binding protein